MMYPTACYKFQRSLSHTFENGNHVWNMVLHHGPVVLPIGIFGTVQPTGLESAAPNQEGLQVFPSSYYPLFPKPISRGG